MLDSLKPYPNALRAVPKEPWLGAVPNHWTLVKLKHVLAERNVRGYPAEPLLASTQTKGVVLKSDYGTRTVEAMKDLHLLKLVRVGDFVISLRSFQGGIEFARNQGIISPAYTILHPRESATHGYLAVLFKSRPFIGNLTLYVTGIRQGQNIDYTNLARSYIPLPPPAEQTGIVRFLGAVDRKVNRFIRAKRRLIEVLTEQKQAIITHAVTRGLNPAAPLKPSGIDWLGDVPEHWRVMAVKRVLRRLIDCEHKTAPAIDAGGAEEYRVVRTTAVRYGRLRLSGTYCTTAEAFAQWTERGLPEPDDVIFTREAPAGEACIVPSEHRVCLGQRTVLMKLRRDRYDPAYLVHMIYAGPPSHRIRIASQGSTVGHFNMDDIADMQVYVPPLAEQQAIVAWIADHTKELDLASAQAEREIDLIREYRTRLVADVVTGKVDVFGHPWAAQDPSEANESALDLCFSSCSEVDDVSVDAEEAAKEAEA